MTDSEIDERFARLQRAFIFHLERAPEDDPMRVLIRSTIDKLTHDLGEIVEDAIRDVAAELKAYEPES